MTKTVKNLIAEAASSFVGSDTAKLDAQLLLAEVLGKDRTWIMTWDDQAVSEADQRHFQLLSSRRALGEPIAYILGRKEFYGLELQCNASTLIPRPETELIVEQALKLGLPEAASVLDLGSGTGAIALSLASEQPQWQIQAVDLSADAVVLAISNRDQLGLVHVEIYQSDWFENIDSSQSFDLIVSNPPYVDPQSAYLNEGDVRFEPKSALTAADHGMADIASIANEAKGFLKPGGYLMMEHGFDQADSIQACFRRSGFEQIQTHDDLAGLPRMTLGRRA